LDSVWIEVTSVPFFNVTAFFNPQSTAIFLFLFLFRPYLENLDFNLIGLDHPVAVSIQKSKVL
jgi:hypothetical protein